MICENVPAFPGINGWFINCRAKANVKTNMWSKSVNHSSMVSCGFPQGCITGLNGGKRNPGHFASSRDHDRNTSVNETCSTFSHEQEYTANGRGQISFSSIQLYL